MFNIRADNYQMAFFTSKKAGKIEFEAIWHQYGKASYENI
jgi:hypothetical protein